MRIDRRFDFKIVSVLKWVIVISFVVLEYLHVPHVHIQRRVISGPVGAKIKSIMTSMSLENQIMSRHRNLILAIEANSVDVVREIIGSGIDLSKLPKFSFELKRGNGNVKASVAQGIYFSSFHVDDDVPVGWLHLALRNIYEHHGDAFISTDLSMSDDDIAACQAQAILDLLLDAGVNPTSSFKFVACNLHCYLWKGFEGDSVCFAMYLKKHSSDYSRCPGKNFDAAIRKLQKAQDSTGHFKPPVVQVAQSALDAWNALMFSDAFADVHFTCGDGLILCAHRAVLASASKYFTALFLVGPWKDSAAGRIETKYSSAVVRALLSFTYTGALDHDLDPRITLAVASEYGLSSMQCFGEQACIRALDKMNCLDMLQHAHLHDSVPLKQACFCFIRRNATHLLVDPAISSFAAEDPALWQDLAAAISGEVVTTHSSSASPAAVPK